MFKYKEGRRMETISTRDFYFQRILANTEVEQVIAA
jgi:hypothetical protein